MPQITSSEDLYRQLVEAEPDDANWLQCLLAFAITEEQRMDWMKHAKERDGQTPDAVAIEDWYQQQPPGVLLRAKGDAENVLRQYFDASLEVFREDERQEILKSALASEIRAVRRLWPQFGINVAGGLASAVLFAGILATIAFFVFMDPSLIQLGQGASK